MGSLGELGVPKVRAADSFTWFGEEMRIGNTSSLLMMDFLEQAVTIDANDVVKSLATIKDGFANIVEAEDFPRFWAICLRERQDVDDLMRLMTQLVEGVTGVPSKRRSDSSAGRRNTAKKSRAGSRSPGQQVVKRLESKGRPDLAIAVRDYQRSLR